MEYVSWYSLTKTFQKLIEAFFFIPLISYWFMYRRVTGEFLIAQSTSLTRVTEVLSTTIWYLPMKLRLHRVSSVTEKCLTVYLRLVSLLASAAARVLWWHKGSSRFIQRIKMRALSAKERNNDLDNWRPRLQPEKCESTCIYHRHFSAEDSSPT